MFKVQYAGPKVEISHHGIKYNDAKEDKYVYLVVALEILQGIDNDYEGRQAYTHHFENKVLEEENLHKVFTAAGAERTDHEWLFQWLTYGLHQLGGHQPFGLLGENPGAGKHE